MYQCPKCLYKSNHPLGLLIYDDMCSGCFTHLEKDTTDWLVKLEELRNLLLTCKKSRRGYDCVVPVMGDAEDFFTVSKVLDLGLSPLIVSVNDYFKNDIGWKNIHQLITHFDVDSLMFNPDIRVYKDLVRTSLRKFNHILLPFIQLHTSFPVHIALERKIPLIIWGQNQSVEQVGKFSHDDAVQMSRWSRREHDLFGKEVGILVGNGAQVLERDLNYYHYPNTDTLSRKNVTGIYLSNYMRWDPLLQNKSTVNFGFTPEINRSSFDIYERAGSSVYYGMHDILKFKRVGYRKVTDHIVREIRHRRIDLGDAKSLNEMYGSVTINPKPFFDWLEVSSSGYEWFLKHRLDDVKHLISHETDSFEPKILPQNIAEQLVNGNASKEKFLAFAKGIEI